MQATHKLLWINIKQFVWLIFLSPFNFFFAVVAVIFSGAESDEKRDASRKKPKEKKFHVEDEEEKDKRSKPFSHSPEEDEDEGQKKRGSRESLNRWTKRAKGLPLKTKAVGKEAEQFNGLHHSKEITEEDEVKKKRNTQRSPEEKELQIIARRAPEERKAVEEEGSGSHKSEVCCLPVTLF